MAVQKIETRGKDDTLVVEGFMNLFLSGHLDSIISGIHTQVLQLLEDVQSATTERFHAVLDRELLSYGLKEILKNCHDAYASIPAYSKTLFEKVRIVFVVSAVKKMVNVLVIDRAGTSPTTEQKRSHPGRYFGGA